MLPRSRIIVLHDNPLVLNRIANWVPVLIGNDVLKRGWDIPLAQLLHNRITQKTPARAGVFYRKKELWASLVVLR